MTTTLLSLEQLLSQQVGDFLEFDTSTNVTTGSTAQIIGTTLNNYDQQTDGKKDQRNGEEPLGKAVPIGEEGGSFQNNPTGAQVGEQHLPERAVVDLDDQLLETRHRTGHPVGMPGSGPKEVVSATRWG